MLTDFRKTVETGVDLRLIIAMVSREMPLALCKLSFL